MTLPTTSLIRFLMMRKHRSRLTTAMMPLNRIRKAVVLMDRTETMSHIAESRIQKYFSEHGIDLLLLSPGKKDLDPTGRIRRSYRYKKAGWAEEDLFISLFPASTFASDYELVCSKSRFKIGRYKVGRAALDIVAYDSPDKSSSQLEAFEYITDILKIIK